MTSAVIFGLLAALLYGLADITGRSTNRINGVPTTLFWSQLVLVVAASIALLFFKLPKAGLAEWALLVIAGMVLTGATAFLYTGLAKGRLSVVAPLMASYGAVSSLLALLTGEHLSAGIGTGLVMTVAGAILCAIRSDDRTSKSSGWIYGAGASLCYGVSYWLQGKYLLPAFGPVPTLWACYVVAVLAIGAYSLMWKRPINEVKGLKGAGLIGLSASLGGGGLAALNLAQADGDIAIATALSSASTLVTVVFAVIALKEKPGVWGWAGITAVIAGIALLNLSSQ
jgi:drug/metabolite transporter (DMT)-like permease